MARGVQGGNTLGPDPIATGDTIVSGPYSGLKAQVAVVAEGPDSLPVPVTAAAPLHVVQTGTPALPTGAASEATLDTRTGSLTEGAPANDTASSGINGRLQRIAQRLSSIIALLPSALGAGGGLKIDGSGTPLATSHDVTGIGDGRKVVTTAGTRVALAGSTVAKSVVITAETDNTGVVVVGAAASVIAALATRVGTPLNAGDTISLQVDNLADVGLDATVSTDGVTFTYLT